jgi:hypothetical protein
MTRTTPRAMVYRLVLPSTNKGPMDAYFPASTEADRALVDLTGRHRHGTWGTAVANPLITKPNPTDDQRSAQRNTLQSSNKVFSLRISTERVYPKGAGTRNHGEP